MKKFITCSLAIALGFILPTLAINLYNFYRYKFAEDNVVAVTSGYDQESIYNVFLHYQVRNSPDRTYEQHGDVVTVGAHFGKYHFWSIEK